MARLINRPWIRACPILQELRMKMLYRTFTQAESAPRFTRSLLGVGMLLASSMPVAYAAKT